MKTEHTSAGLFWALVFRVVPLTVLTFLAIGYIIVTRAFNSVSEQVEAYHTEQHRYAEFAVKRKLDTLKESVRVLAGNDLVVNALIDIENRNQYLPIFFRSLRIPGPEKAHIFLVDYKGHPIVCNQGHMKKHAQETFWENIAKGREYFELTPEKLLFAAPVLYHGLAEGSIIVVYAPEQFYELFNVEVGVDSVALTGRGGNRIFSSHKTPGQLLTMQRYPADWFVQKTALKGYPELSIATYIFKQKAMQPAKSLRNFLILVICLNILVLLLSQFLTGRIVTEPIANLIDGIQNIMKNGELACQIQETGPRELRKIARAFNRLVSQLRKTMVSRSHLDSMINAMTESVFVTDLEGKIVSSNPAFRSLFGYQKSELMSLQIKQLLNVGDAQGFLREVLLSGSISDRKISIRNRMKREHTVLHSCSLIPANTEKQAEFIHVIHDITQSHQNALALEAERQRLRLVIEGTRTGLWDWNVQTGETVFNERWAEIVGYTLAELAPASIQTWMDLCHPDDLEQSNTALDQHFSGKADFYNCECRMRHKNGHWVWVLDRGKVLEWTADREPLRMAGTHVDVSDRKQVEEELQRANEMLEQRVRERTQELKNMQSQMVMQEKMASVGQLAAGIAHELNNPINFVRTNFATLNENFTDLREIFKDYQGFMNIYGDRYDTPPEFSEIRDKEASLQIDYILEDIPAIFSESENGFERVARIIQSMRDFSHVDYMGNLKYFNINKGIEDTLVIAGNVYKYYAEIKKDFGELPEILCLPEQLNQVFLNLIVNSAQALEVVQEKGKGLISIRTWVEKTHVCCEIADNGAGIPADIRNRVFEPFFTTKDPGKGTGLGLSISYDIIVHKHKGELTVECPETGGTVFTLRIPVNLKPAEVKK